MLRAEEPAWHFLARRSVKRLLLSPARSNTLNCQHNQVSSRRSSKAFVFQRCLIQYQVVNGKRPMFPSPLDTRIPRTELWMGHRLFLDLGWKDDLEARGRIC